MYSFRPVFTKLSALLLLLSLSSFSFAAPFTVTYVDSVDISSTAQFNAGEAFTISIVLDNGGTSNASQTWAAADIVSITFNINDAPNTITTVFSPVVLSTATGSFVTDAAGILTAVPSNWTDTIDASTVASSNDPNIGTGFDYFINAVNGVYYTDSFSNDAYMTNVTNNTVATSWSNPIAAMMPPAPATAVPTLSEWSMILLSLMLMGFGLHKTRRFD